MSIIRCINVFPPHGGANIETRLIIHDLNNRSSIKNDFDLSKDHNFLS